MRPFCIRIYEQPLFHYGPLLWIWFNGSIADLATKSPRTDTVTLLPLAGVLTFSKALVPSITQIHLTGQPTGTGLLFHLCE